jgi:hypothetical protein
LQAAKQGTKIMTNPNSYIETSDDDEQAAMDASDAKYADGNADLFDELIECRANPKTMLYLVEHHPYLVREIQGIYDARVEALEAHRQKLADRQPPALAKWCRDPENDLDAERFDFMS